MRDGIGRRGFVKLIITLLLLVGIVFVGMSFGKPYYRFNTLRSHTKDILLQDIGNVDLIKKKIMEDAAELNVPLEEGNLEVVIIPTTKMTKVKATWSEVVDFWGYYQKKFDFVMETEY